VFHTLQNNGDEDAEETAKRAVEIYDYRSKLVHDGMLSQPLLGNLINETKHIVERILRIKFIQLSKAI
jgi:hypothetical protein